MCQIYNELEDPLNDFVKIISKCTKFILKTEFKIYLFIYLLILFYNPAKKDILQSIFLLYYSFKSFS